MINHKVLALFLFLILVLPAQSYADSVCADTTVLSSDGAFNCEGMVAFSESFVSDGIALVGTTDTRAKITTDSSTPNSLFFSFSHTFTNILPSPIQYTLHVDGEFKATDDNSDPIRGQRISASALGTGFNHQTVQGNSFETIPDLTFLGSFSPFLQVIVNISDLCAALTKCNGSLNVQNEGGLDLHVFLTEETAVIPEPSTLLLLGCSLGGLVLFGSRRFLLSNPSGILTLKS